MRKVLGIALAMLFTLTMAAAAEESVATRTSAFDDSIKLTVSEKPLSNLAPGEQVKATYETSGSTNVATGSDFRGSGSDLRATTSWGPSYGTSIDSIQAE